MALAVISTCCSHKLRKMEKQNEELNRRVKEQEAELTRLKQQKTEAGKEPE